MRSFAEIATVVSFHPFFAVLPRVSRDLIFTARKLSSVRRYLATVIPEISPAMALGEKDGPAKRRKDEQKRTAA
jgi:hypothetical protein